MTSEDLKKKAEWYDKVPKDSAVRREKIVRLDYALVELEKARKEEREKIEEKWKGKALVHEDVMATAIERAEKDALRERDEWWGNKIADFEKVLKAIRVCTQPIDGHTDPLSVNDCWKEVDDLVVEAKKIKESEEK